MPRAVTRVARRDVSVGSDQVGGLGDRLSSGIGSGGLGLGHSEMLRRKRSLDNLENIPPFGLDGGALSAGDKPAVSLLDLTAAQHSQSQRKQRRTVITASSPGGHQRMATNPRRATMHSDGVSQHSGSITPCSSQTRPRQQPPGSSSGRQTPAMRTPLGANGSSGGSSRLRRLPKRNLKPLDFSGLHGPKTQAGGATAAATAPATATSSRSGGYAPILALPVSPAQSSPLEQKTQRTPPSTGPRQQAAFAGVLASAYQRASGRRVSQRTLRFEGGSEAGLQESDPVLGPRCPVIGAPRGVFGEAAAESPQGREAARQAQAAFEVAVAEQSTTRGRSGRRPGRPAGRGRGRRAVSECKYCGKQYKYHSKLASHEQHCASRLEALLYSADESEQHVIHCVCGPRHGRAAGARDEQAMVQCDGCLCWLHISCVGMDESSLPAEFFCTRCTPADDPAPTTPRRGSARAGSGMSPESHRLAALLAHVPDNDGSETEEEPMSLRLKARARRGRGSVQAAEGSSEDTMSISDVAEVTRFHRQGSTVRACRSPVAPRMAQSETNVSPAATPRRRRVRASASTQPTVHTDAPSSDFLGLPFPESIFSEKPSFGEGGASADLLPPVPPGLCGPQTSMDNLSQWSLAQLSTMLSATAPPASGAPDSSFLLGNSLADLGLGLDGAGPADPTGDAQFGSADLSQLVDMPTDAQFSALLDSFASGEAADAYSSLGAGSSFGSDGLPAVSAAPGTGSRLLGSRIAGSVDVGHGSSSTITLMHDGSSACEQDTAPVLPAPVLPASARPPPGLPGMIRERNGGTKRSSLVGTAHSSLVGPAMSAAMALSLSSNPPSSSGIGDLDVGQMLNFQLDGDVLERELEGLINFDA
ncbi:hypothetical protein LPJ78_001133 [Coemansia sp. RSA 989]|nr:hypothetical protein LPJ78_001133 [Coemansia sp. RSA 989]